MESRWTCGNPREFTVGDIICDKESQDFYRLVVYVDNVALWVIGLTHCALTENYESHPIYPMYFEEIDDGVYEPMMRLGNLKDYSEFINRVQTEVADVIKNIDGYSKYSGR